MDCIGIGISTLDLMVEVDAFPLKNSKNVATRAHIGGGGPTANAAAALAALGLKTGLVSVVGDDLFGKTNLAELEVLGVDISGVQVVAADKANYAHVIVERGTGHRTIILNKSEAPEIDPDLVPERFRRDTKGIILDSRANPSMLEVAAMMKNLGAQIMFDGGSVQTYTAELLAIADFPIVSENFAEEYFGNSNHQKNVVKLLQHGSVIAGITLGSNGSILARDGEILEIPAFPIHAIDTTGAGDLYHAGLFYGILQKWDIPAMGQFASALAAIGCLSLGARGGIPSLDDVREFLISHSISNHPVL